MSMTFDACKIDDSVLVKIAVLNETSGPNCANGDFASVFSINEKTEYVYNPDPDAKLVANPGYMPICDMNISSGNAEGILELIGYKVIDGCFHAEINDFIARLNAALVATPADLSDEVYYFRTLGRCSPSGPMAQI
ncbi:MAG: hypothetical protein V4441_13135 [Pseudomonadota bacterium]